MSKNPKSSGLLDKGENKTKELFTEICKVVRLNTEIRSSCSEVGSLWESSFLLSVCALCHCLYMLTVSLLWVSSSAEGEGIQRLPSPNDSKCSQTFFGIMAWGFSFSKYFICSYIFLNLCMVSSRPCDQWWIEQWSVSQLMPMKASIFPIQSSHSRGPCSYAKIMCQIMKEIRVITL